MSYIDAHARYSYSSSPEKLNAHNYYHYNYSYLFNRISSSTRLSKQKRLLSLVNVAQQETFMFRLRPLLPVGSIENQHHIYPASVIAELVNEHPFSDLSFKIVLKNSQGTIDHAYGISRFWFYLLII